MKLGGLCTSAIVALMMARAAAADVKTWRGGTATGDWFSASNWTNGVPADGDEAVIAAGACLLTNETAALAAFTMQAGTLICSNWGARLVAETVTLTGGVITLPPAFSNGFMTNRVWIVCSNLTLGAAARIDADRKGWRGGAAGGVPGVTDGSGPGGGLARQGAGSYGGRGAGGTKGGYGDFRGPQEPGSGGAGDSWAAGGDGGGAIRIDASGSVTVDGTITANGGSAGTRSGGGSGGSIYIACQLLAGSSPGGRISANGGLATSTDYGPGAGGGRIAILYDSAAQASAPVPLVRVSAAAGTRVTSGQPGTLFFPDNRLLQGDVVTCRGRWMVDGVSALAFSSLAISNGWLSFPDEGFRLTVSNELTLIGDNAVDAYGVRLYDAGRLDLTNGILEVGGGALLTNGAMLQYVRSATGLVERGGLWVGGDLRLAPFARVVLQSAATNTSPGEYAGFLSVTGDLSVATNAWVYLYSHPTNGGSCLIRARSVYVEPNGGFSADSAGYRSALAIYTNDNWGPGRGIYPSGGGSYGGEGRLPVVRAVRIGNEPGGVWQRRRRPGSRGRGRRRPGAD